MYIVNHGITTLMEFAEKCALYLLVKVEVPLFSADTLCGVNPRNGDQAEIRRKYYPQYVVLCW